MPFIGIGTSQAETLVEARFDDANDFATRAKNEIKTLITALVALAKSAATIDIDNTIPLTQPDIPETSPFSEYLVSGATGIADDTDIWQRGLDRAAEIYLESLDTVAAQFGGFSSIPSDMYDALVQSRLDRYDWELLDLARFETSQGFNVASEFAKFISNQISQWTLAMKGAEAKQAIAIAELRLKQVESEMREFLEKSGLELSGYVEAGDTAAHLAAAAEQAVSASASISDSGSDSADTSVSTSYSTEDRTSTSTTDVTSTEDSTTTITGDE